MTDPGGNADFPRLVRDRPKMAGSPRCRPSNNSEQEGAANGRFVVETGTTGKGYIRFLK